MEFSSSTLSVSESDGSLVVPLVLSGQTQSQPFSIVVIAEADNSSLSSRATGMGSCILSYTLKSIEWIDQSYKQCYISHIEQFQQPQCYVGDHSAILATTVLL